jgi:hypothetical protein
MTRGRRLASGALVGLGLLSLVGFALDLPSVRGLGFATAASPLPFVFSKFRGVENFAADFDITVTQRSGETHSFRMDQEAYAKLQGPYNRRNPYGAVIAYGPMLTQPKEVAMRESVLRYGACNHGPLARELGLEGAVARLTIRFHSRTRGAQRSWEFAVDCP